VLAISIAWGTALAASPLPLAAWLLWVGAPAGFGVFLRRLLKLSPSVRKTRFSETRQRLCEVTSVFLDTELAMLAVLLNDAIEASIAGNAQTAEGLLQLTLSQWNRLASILVALLREIAKYLPAACIASPVPTTMTEHFRSDPMLDYARLHKRLSHFLLRTRPRFALQVRMLRDAVELLTADFRSESGASPAPESGVMQWERFDRDFYDFDILTKKVMLAFDFFSACLPESAVGQLAFDVRPLLRHALEPIAN
jgi:hypothetical protein